MRVLVLQTPRLTYVQTLDIILRETRQRKVDLVVLPEFSLDHPAQCTNQGELSHDNVAFMMLARLAKQRNLYIVLGSVEERCQSEGQVHDTCVVFDCRGEMRFHRKGSKGSKEASAIDAPPLSPAPVFDMEGFGTVGLLIGSEVEDSVKWSNLLCWSPRPCLLLNPCSAPIQLDAGLAKAPPIFAPQVAPLNTYSRTHRIT